MTMRTVWIGVGAMLLAAPVMAAEPAGKIDAQGLATMRGTIAFCSSHNPAAAAGLEKLGQQMVSGLSASDLSKLENSEAYRAALAKVEESLKDVAESDASAACQAALE